MRYGLVVAAVAVSLAACGSGSDGRTGAGPTGTTMVTPSGSSPSPGSSETSNPSTKRPTTPTADGTGSPGTRATAGGSTGRLDRACARRGVDTQGITIETAPGGPVGFNTLYSDGSSNLDTDYRDGFGGGFADQRGLWRQTWVVPENSPAGLATVRVVVQGVSFDLTYTIVGGDGGCP